MSVSQDNTAFLVNNEPGGRARGRKLSIKRTTCRCLQNHHRRDNLVDGFSPIIGKCFLLWKQRHVFLEPHMITRSLAFVLRFERKKESSNFEVAVVDSSVLSHYRAGRSSTGFFTWLEHFFLYFTLIIRLVYWTTRIWMLNNCRNFMAMFFFGKILGNVM